MNELHSFLEVTFRPFEDTIRDEVACYRSHRQAYGL